MKIAVWCSKGQRPPPNKLTDAEQLEELQDPNVVFNYMDTDINVIFKKHTEESLTNLGIEPYTYDVVVLENCPIGTLTGYIDIDLVNIIIPNAMLMLKDGGRLFVRHPKEPSITFGSFVKSVGFALSLKDGIGLLDFASISRNGLYMIYSLNKQKRTIVRPASLPPSSLLPEPSMNKRKREK